MTTLTGEATQAGFYTLTLDQPVQVVKDSKFCVMVKFTGDGYPLAAEARIDGYTSNATASAGESFFSCNGISWNDLYATYGSDGWMNVCIKAIMTINGGYFPVITSFTAEPTSGEAPLTVNFTCEATDPDGSISAYKWDFDGDGQTDQTTTTNTITYTYNNAGTYQAQVTVVDDKGTETTSNALTITVISPVCGPEHLELCTTEQDCVNAGGYWYDDVCNAEPAPCDANHLWACTTKQDCIDAGGYWYNDTCNAAAFNGAPAEPMIGYTLYDIVEEPAAVITVDNDAQKAMVVIPVLMVPNERVGDSVHLYWTWCDSITCAPDIYDLGVVVLNETVEFPILSNETDLSRLSGNFYIFVGFAMDQVNFSDVVWNWYELIFE